jgi:hypothetical protein
MTEKAKQPDDRLFVPLESGKQYMYQGLPLPELSKVILYSPPMNKRNHKRPYKYHK